MAGVCSLQTACEKGVTCGRSDENWYAQFQYQSRLVCTCVCHTLWSNRPLMTPLYSVQQTRSLCACVSVVWRVLSFKAALWLGYAHLLVKGVTCGRSDETWYCTVICTVPVETGACVWTAVDM